MAKEFLDNTKIDSEVSNKIPEEYVPYVKFILNKLIERKLEEIEILYKTEGTSFSEFGICSLVLPDLAELMVKEDSEYREEISNDYLYTSDKYNPSLMRQDEFKVDWDESDTVDF